VKPDRPSETAEMVCAWRALENLMPEGERILTDPFARSFLGPARSGLLDVAEKLPQRALKALFRRVDRVIQGVFTFVLARHRAMDDLLCAQEGIEQVVLLGAGYDTRSVRLADALGDAVLFEVDHPATAARKQSLVDQAFGDRPRAKTVSVTVDFARESIADRLLEAGLQKGKRTFWIWEGVSMYLDEEAVRDTLRMIRSLSAAGALVIFDAWCPPAEGISGFAHRDLPTLAMKLVYSEPFVWAPQVGDLDGFVREQGLALIESTLADDLVTRYTKRRPGLLQRVMGSNMVLCTAEVERE
jgi:methyltransferase (TIGR00027 family)